MKIILNKCYGGFSVSAEGYRLYCRKKGLKCYFYTSSYKNGKSVYQRLQYKEAKDAFMLHCFHTDNAAEVNKALNPVKSWWEMSHQEKKEYNDTYRRLSLYLNYEHRTDETLIEVVEELGERASGKYGNLKVIEIPDDIKYEVDDYDGIETVHELHRSW